MLPLLLQPLTLLLLSMTHSATRCQPPWQQCLLHCWHCPVQDCGKMHSPANQILVLKHWV
jgi:hypothetical protein